MLVRNVFENDFLEISNKAREWGDLVIERESIYHIMTKHFRDTCFVAEDRGKIIGYLLGFRSQINTDHAYMHLIHVSPGMRGYGVGRRMLKQFEDAARSMGCNKIFTIVRPENKYALGFASVMGFKVVEDGDIIEVNGVRARKDYNGPGKHMVIWSKDL